MKKSYFENGYYSPLKIYDENEGKYFRNKLESTERKIGKIHYIVKTYKIMKWVYEVATNSILLDFVEEILQKPLK